MSFNPGLKLLYQQKIFQKKKEKRKVRFKLKLLTYLTFLKKFFLTY